MPLDEGTERREAHFINSPFAKNFFFREEAPSIPLKYRSFLLGKPIYAVLYIILESRFVIVERITHELKERQRVVDHYYPTESFDYFGNVCKCSLACVLYNLRRDRFVRSILASLALFAVGLKLCSELDAWEMPSPVS